jgi:hypothetical protein
MALLHLGGPLFNNVGRAAVPIFSVAPGADSRFPTTRLYDNFQHLIFQFSSNSSTPSIVVDQNFVVGGNMETLSAGVPTAVGTGGAWFKTTTGTATVAATVVAGEFQSGVQAVKITSGSGQGMLAVPILARANEVFRVSLGLRGDGVNAAMVQIYNRHNGKYYDGAAWQASAATTAATRVTNTYATVTIDVATEVYGAVLTDVMTLEIRLLSTNAAGIAYFDNVFAWPKASFFSIHGHNIDLTGIWSWLDSDDGVTTGTARGFFSLVKPSTYAVDAGGGSLKRYQHLSGSAASASTPWIGEIVIGQADTMTRDPNNGWQMEMSVEQVRLTTGIGTKRGVLLGPPVMGYERRPFRMKFFYTSASDYQQAQDYVFRRTMGGHYPSVWVPDTNHPTKDCRFGYILDSWGPINRPLTGMWEAGFDFAEEPFPLVTA